MGKNSIDLQRLQLLRCPKCGESFIVSHIKESPRFCLLCGHNLDGLSKEESASLWEPIQGLDSPPPKEEEILFELYHYKILKKIGQGGMGEVFIAFDSKTGRKIALKRIREDIQKYPQIENRFLREALITSQLSHPSIIPIYSIHHEKKRPFYTMPYVEGETLKERLRKIREEEKEGSKEHSASSIGKLIRIFLQICQAISYSHLKGILHKDIKPENILLGKFGEVFVHDWGIAQILREKKPKKRKLSGTFAYLPPETAKGAPDSILGDIFALGVVLYQILTLKMPFRRKNLEEFKTNAFLETIVHPQKAAPFRDIPEPLSEITLKALASDEKRRYPSVQAMISDLENTLEGKGEFHLTGELNPSNATDWEFQENVLMFEHAALSRPTKAAEWSLLMISRAHFGQNIRQTIDLTLKPESKGIGFVVNAEEAKERKSPFVGLAIFLSTTAGESRLLRSSVEILTLGDHFLEIDKKMEIIIEQSDQRLQLFINGKEIITYVHHLPERGKQIGLFSKDYCYEIHKWQVFEASPSVLVNCLAIPDAFLAHRDYQKAYSEYQKIAHSFSGLLEGREAIFRAGVTLLEEGKETVEIQKAHTLFAKSLQEFGKLKATPAFPLEQLGRALVWRTIGDLDEEVKSFSLALRKKSHHPLRQRVEEELLFRLTEASLYESREAYSFLHLVLEEAPRLLERDSLKAIIHSLENHAEIPYFFEQLPRLSENRDILELFLLFWLGKSHALRKLTDRWKEKEVEIYKSLYFALEELGVKTALEESFNPETARRSHLLQLRKWQERREWEKVVLEVSKYEPLPHDLSLIAIEAYLFLQEWKKAEKELSRYTMKTLSSEESLLPFLYGCFILGTESEEIAQLYFAGLLGTSYPRSWDLGRCAILESLPHRWFSKAFLWEKRELSRQLALYFSVKGEFDKRDESFSRLSELIPIE